VRSGQPLAYGAAKAGEVAVTKIVGYAVVVSALAHG
jgi:hypothetical protein